MGGLAKHGQPHLVQHARVEHGHAVAGLFAALPRRQRPRREVLYQVSDDELWYFREFEALGADDQTVLLSILAMIAQHRQPLGADEATRVLALSGESRTRESLYLVTSARQICRECGWAWSAKRWQWLQQSLTRLSATTYDIRRQGVTRSAGTLIARMVREDGKIAVAINPVLARVWLDPTQQTLWAKVSLDERRTLSTDTAQVLHGWLCAWLRPGQSHTVQLGTLIPHVWPDNADTAAAGTRKARRYHLREALQQIGQLPGWSVGPVRGPGAIRITRASEASRGREEGA